MDIVSRVSNYENDIQSDISQAGAHFSKILEQSVLQEGAEKKIRFLCSQMMLTGKNPGEHRYDATIVRDSLKIYLRSRSAYKALRDFLVLPCDKVLKSYFGKLGTAGSSNECLKVVGNVFSELAETERFCYISADEIYVKAAVRYRGGGQIIGLGVDQDPPKPAKTILALMINFLYKIPAFIARLIAVTSLKAELLEEQLILLIHIIHNIGGYVFLTMTDNLSVK